MNNDDFSRLLRRAIEGEVAATSELLTRCEPEIQRIVRANLPRKIRSKFDSMDFVQAVWKSVLTKDSDVSPKFEGESHFVRYVAGVAKNKVIEQFRRHTKTEKYNIALEEPLYIKRGAREILRELPAPDPTPSRPDLIPWGQKKVGDAQGVAQPDRNRGGLEGAVRRPLAHCLLRRPLKAFWRASDARGESVCP